MSFHYVSRVSIVPKAITDLAPMIDIFYVGLLQPGEMVELSSRARIPITHHISDPVVAPGALDIVFIPGPDPDAEVPKEVTAWLAAHASRPETDILSVCSGAYTCGAAGILKGRNACGPRIFQDDLREKFPEATWVGDELRWVQDGNIWSSGAVTNGNDLVAAYARQSPHFPDAIVEMAIEGCAVGDRRQRFEDAKPS
ncbi:hypothetical protein GQ53DRAFT_747018 [Thozetella sp. PMI_491]|nr:hypothetical protein GQ53DRAFT_747018 [Thozetella sp. PMI_491]